MAYHRRKEIHMPENLRPRDCRCARAVADGGKCIRCGKYLLERDPETGLPKTEAA